jgi:hypothetical protein
LWVKRYRQSIKKVPLGQRRICTAKMFQVPLIKKMSWIGVFAAIPGYGTISETVGVTLFTKATKTTAAVGDVVDYTQTTVGFTDDAGWLDGLKSWLKSH